MKNLLSIVFVVSAATIIALIAHYVTRLIRNGGLVGKTFNELFCGDPYMTRHGKVLE
jgi:hypothetical protein